MSDSFDGVAFIGEVEPELVQLGDISRLILKKQSRDMGILYESMTPKQADDLMKKVENALEAFLGSKGKVLIHRIIKKALRKHAPEYFEKTYAM